MENKINQIFSISIDQNDGDIFTESLNLSGVSNIPPTDLSWKILDIGDNNGTEIVMESKLLFRDTI